MSFKQKERAWEETKQEKEIAASRVYPKDKGIPREPAHENESCIKDALNRPSKASRRKEKKKG